MEAIQRRNNDTYKDTLENAIITLFYPLDSLVDILGETNDRTEVIIEAVTERMKNKVYEFVELIEKEVGPVSFQIAHRHNSLGVCGGRILGVKVGSKENQEVAA